MWIVELTLKFRKIIGELSNLDLLGDPGGFIVIDDSLTNYSEISAVGSAPTLGVGCCRFESCISDHSFLEELYREYY